MIPGCVVPQKPLFRVSAIKALTMLGLTSVLCLDAGDSASYTSGQQWTDRSGSANHFNRGSTSGADATDPTFNGTAGLLSNGEYFSFDGGDYFTPAAAVTFDDDFHIDNAKLTLIALFWTSTATTARFIFGNSDAGVGKGVSFGTTAANGISFVAKNATGTAVSLSSTPILTSLWNFMAVSVDEGAGANGSFERVNKTVALKDGTYATPATTGGTSNPQIGARGGTSVTSILQNGDRLAMFLAFSTNLTKGQMAAFHSIIQGRFPGI